MYSAMLPLSAAIEPKLKKNPQYFGGSCGKYENRQTRVISLKLINLGQTRNNS